MKAEVKEQFRYVPGKRGTLYSEGRMGGEWWNKAALEATLELANRAGSQGLNVSPIAIASVYAEILSLGEDSELLTRARLGALAAADAYGDWVGGKCDPEEVLNLCVRFASQT